MQVVFFDLETGGLDPARHPIIQIAAVAVGDKLEEISCYERKIQFDISAADPEALQKNSFDLEKWASDAVPPAQMVYELNSYLKQYADVEMTSKAGNPYFVAQLAGHNAASFDFNFLKEFYAKQGKFLPASYSVLDTLQRMRWHFHENPQLAKPVDFKLGSLCQYFGVPLEDAHDALADVRATVAIYRKLVEVEH